MKRLSVLFFLVLFVTGCFNYPYTTSQPNTTTGSSYPYQANIGEPKKMQPCNYDSLEGRGIVLSKRPDEKQQITQKGQTMTLDPSKIGYPTIKVAPSLNAGNLSSKKYSETEGKIIGEVKAQYESAAAKRGVLSTGSFSDKYYKIVLSDCSIVYANTGVGPLEYVPKKNYDKAQKLLGDSLWVDRRNEYFDFGKNSEAKLSHLEVVQVTTVEPISITNPRVDAVDDQISSVTLRVKTFQNEEATLPYNEDYYFTKNPINAEWPTKIKYAIKNQEIMIGMTEEQARLSWGRPMDINRTVTEENISEQWVYEGGAERTYLYFENGELTSYQN